MKSVTARYEVTFDVADAKVANKTVLELLRNLKGVREAKLVEYDIPPSPLESEPPAAKPPPPPRQPTQTKRAMAAGMGFTGDMCGQCGQFTMRRNGSCLVCVSCGTTTGCS